MKKIVLAGYYSVKKVKNSFFAEIVVGRGFLFLFTFYFLPFTFPFDLCFGLELKSWM